MSEQFDLFINGKWLSTEEKVEVLNKYSQSIYATVSKAGEKEVDLAIESARAVRATTYSPRRSLDGHTCLYCPSEAWR